MDLAAGLLNVIWSPAGAFADTLVDFTEKRSRVNEDSIESLNCPASASGDWQPLDTNLKIGLEFLGSLKSPETWKWRIDGSDSQGTQFFALPVFLAPKLVPLRVDVFIPDQLSHPPQLRAALGSISACYIRDERVAELGISRLILHVLERWTSKQVDFEKEFNRLTFGSRIILQNITMDVEQIKVRMISDHKTER